MTTDLVAIPPVRRRRVQVVARMSREDVDVAHVLPAGRFVVLADRDAIATQRLQREGGLADGAMDSEGRVVRSVIGVLVVSARADEQTAAHPSTSSG